MTTTTTAAPVKQFTIIRFATTRGTGRYVSSVSFADGPGYRVKSVTHTSDREKAARFSLTTAREIALQYPRNIVSLERPDGTPLATETTELQQDHANIRENNLRVQQQFAKDLNEIFQPGTPGYDVMQLALRAARRRR